MGLRAVDEEKRTAEVSFSSEEPYQRWDGLEILDHSDGCVDLSRLKNIGCVLFNHDSNQVIGQILKADIKDKRGIATIKFDDDEASDVIFQKVKSGTLKGLSVGYRTLTIERVPANKKSSDGRFTGPCYIAKRWMPYEISIVSVPADATVGVGRSDEGQKGRSLGYFSRQLQYNQNISNGGKRK
jgi:HK97 family phage prohead protease